MKLRLQVHKLHIYFYRCFAQSNHVKKVNEKKKIMQRYKYKNLQFLYKALLQHKRATWLKCKTSTTSIMKNYNKRTIHWFIVIYILVLHKIKTISASKSINKRMAVERIAVIDTLWIFSEASSFKDCKVLSVNCKNTEDPLIELQNVRICLSDMIDSVLELTLT